MRNAEQAVALATRACELTEFQVPEAIDTLAAAYAEASRFADAVTVGTRALALAHARGNQGLASEIQKRLDRYRAGKPFRQSPLEW